MIYFARLRNYIHDFVNAQSNSRQVLMKGLLKQGKHTSLLSAVSSEDKHQLHHKCKASRKYQSYTGEWPRDLRSLDNGIYMWFQSFHGSSEQENSIKDRCPFKIDIVLSSV